MHGKCGDRDGESEQEGEMHCSLAVVTNVGVNDSLRSVGMQTGEFQA